MNNLSLVGSNSYSVRRHNLRAVLLTFLHRGLISRVQLAEETNLSNTTITNLIAELIDQGIIVEKEKTADPLDKQPRRGVGRPRRMLELVPDARYVVGVHIGIGMFRVAVTNLNAEIIYNKMTTFPIDQSSYDVLDAIANAISDSINHANITPGLILGVGIGASGLVNHETGVNLHAASLGWHKIPIQEILEQKLPYSVSVDNNVRAMALGEAYFGLGRGADVSVFIYGRIGVGSGIVVKGQAFRGSGAGAGEIGHTIVQPHNGDLCRCGQYGCLETLVSEPVLLREAQRLAEQQPDGTLAEHLNRTEGSPIDDVFDAARAGDKPSFEMIERQMHYLGIALANLVNVLNPELIILGGMFAQGSDLIVPKVEPMVHELAFGGLGEKVKLQTTSFGWRAGVIGAAAIALTTFFYQPAEPI